MSAKRPNILFFFTDDQRFDTIRALGNDEIQTPNLDALAAQGTTFTRAHIPGGTSGAVCMPSRAMLHTGRTLFHLQGEGQEIPDDHITMGEAFRAAGYDTFATGKWHNERAAFARSFSHGSEIFFGGMADHWNVPAYDFDPTGRYEATCPVVSTPMENNEVQYRKCDHIRAGKHSTDLFVDATIDFIENQPPERPFFAYVSLMAPHDPRTMPRQFLEMYDAASVRLPENFAPEHLFNTGALRIRDELLAAFPREPDEIRCHIAEYYAMVSHLDDGLGRLTGVLHDLQLLDETIIVFAGDNGLALGQHGLMGKQSLYDHSVRVPLIFAGPGINAEVKDDDLVYLLDIFPTLCELADIPVPATVEGHSLVSALSEIQLDVDPEVAEQVGPTIAKRSREFLYLAYHGTIRGLTDGYHKLIEYAGGETQLFDLIADPCETENIAAGNRSKVATMRTRMVELRDVWQDRDHPLGAEFWEQRKDI